MTQNTEVKSDLEVLFPTGKDVVIKGVAINIKAFKLGELPRVFLYLKPISSSLFNALQNKMIGDIGVIIGILGEGGESLIKLLEMAVAPSLVKAQVNPENWVRELEVDESITLFTALIEVNADFFIKRVLPNINRQTDRLNQIVGQGQ